VRPTSWWSAATRGRPHPEPIDLVWNRKVNPGKVFDLTLPLDQVAEGYRARG
jgi:threonine dehydrogenase-like Zn-dependent dehydrogenase